MKEKHINDSDNNQLAKNTDLCSISTTYSNNEEILKFIKRCRPEVTTLVINSQKYPEFLRAADFYLALNDKENIFLVYVALTERTDEDTLKKDIKSRIDSLQRPIIIQCGEVTKTKVYVKKKKTSKELITIDLNKTAEPMTEVGLLNQLKSKDSFGIALIVEALKQGKIGWFNDESNMSLTNITFDVNKALGDKKIIQQVALQEEAQQVVLQVLQQGMQQVDLQEEAQQVVLQVLQQVLQQVDLQEEARQVVWQKEAQQVVVLALKQVLLQVDKEKKAQQVVCQKEVVLQVLQYVLKRALKNIVVQQVALQEEVQQVVLKVLQFLQKILLKEVPQHVLQELPRQVLQQVLQQALQKEDEQVVSPEEAQQVVSQEEKKTNCSLLDYAVFHNDFLCTRLLSPYNWNLFAPKDEELSTLEIAAKYASPHILAMLLKLQLPLPKKNISEKKLLLKIADLLKPSNYYRNNTPLLTAAKKGKEDNVVFLVMCGADINVADKNEMTPLCYANKAEKNSMIKFLVDCGAKTKGDLLSDFKQYSAFFESAKNLNKILCRVKNEPYNKSHPFSRFLDAVARILPRYTECTAVCIKSNTDNVQPLENTPKMAIEPSHIPVKSTDKACKQNEINIKVSPVQGNVQAGNVKKNVEDSTLFISYNCTVSEDKKQFTAYTIQGVQESINDQNHATLSKNTAVTHKSFHKEIKDVITDSYFKQDDSIYSELTGLLGTLNIGIDRCHSVFAQTKVYSKKEVEEITFQSDTLLTLLENTISGLSQKKNTTTNQMTENALKCLNALKDSTHSITKNTEKLFKIMSKFPNGCLKKILQNPVTINNPDKLHAEIALVSHIIEEEVKKEIERELKDELKKIYKWGFELEVHKIVDYGLENELKTIDKQRLDDEVKEELQERLEIKLKKIIDNGLEDIYLKKIGKQRLDEVKKELHKRLVDELKITEYGLENELKTIDKQRLDDEVKEELQKRLVIELKKIIEYGLEDIYLKKIGKQRLDDEVKKELQKRLVNELKISEYGFEEDELKKIAKWEFDDEVKKKLKKKLGDAVKIIVKEMLDDEINTIVKGGFNYNRKIYNEAYRDSKIYNALLEIRQKMNKIIGYVGISKRCCALCHKTLKLLEVKHRGTHNTLYVCEEWKIPRSLSMILTYEQVNQLRKLIEDHLIEQAKILKKNLIDRTTLEQKLNKQDPDSSDDEMETQETDNITASTKKDLNITGIFEGNKCIFVQHPTEDISSFIERRFSLRLTATPKTEVTENSGPQNSDH